MNWFIAIVGILGLYFLLSWLGIQQHVAFSAMGITMTWFGVLFVAGSAVILRATVLGK